MRRVGEGRCRVEEVRRRSRPWGCGKGPDEDGVKGGVVQSVIQGRHGGGRHPSEWGSGVEGAWWLVGQCWCGCTCLPGGPSLRSAGLPWLAGLVASPVCVGWGCV